MIKPFKFWAQHVLPLVYDDSLSYYEVLSKIAKKLNETIDAQNTLGVSFDELKQYVDDYFKNLNVTDIINNKLDEMAQDGTLEQIINEEIFNDLNTEVTALSNRVDNNEKTRFYITPEMFGAKGDGVTDDSEAIQAAIDSLLTTNKGKALEFGNKIYIVNQTVYFWDVLNSNIKFNGSELRTQAQGIDILYVGYPKNGGNGSSNKDSIEGPVTFNCMGLARSGMRVHGCVDNGYYNDITILNVATYGILCDASSNNTEKNFFNNIQIFGLYNNLNDTTSVGMEIRSWDTIACNIATFSLHGGINMSGANSGGGGILLVNHHHWQNYRKFNNAIDYAKGYGIQLYRGQLTNLYYDCGNGVVCWGTTGDVAIDNIHMECENKNRADWYEESIMILNRDFRNTVSLGTHYMIGGGTGVKLYTYRCNSNLSTLGTNRISIQTPFVCTSSVRGALGVIDEANDLFTLFKPKGVFIGAVPTSASEGYYLIGYIMNSQTFVATSFINIVINRSLYTVMIDHRENALSASVIDRKGLSANYGAIVIDKDNAVTENNINAFPLYYCPTYNGGSYPAYSQMDITPISNCGSARIFIEQAITNILTATKVNAVGENAVYCQLN